MLASTVSSSSLCPVAMSRSQGGGGGGGGNAPGKKAGTGGRVYLTPGLAPLAKIKLFPTNQEKDLFCPPPRLQDIVNPTMTDQRFFQVMQTPATSSPPPPARTALKGKEGDAAATAAPDPSTANRGLRCRARRLLFGRLRGRGWPGGSVSGRVWLGVGRDDD